VYNYKPKLAEVDPENPNMWFRCDRCGFITNHDKGVWQFDFRGTPNPINTRILTCGRPTCLDEPNPQMAPIILSPDPEPVFNARPYPYEASEASWLITTEGDVLTTQDGTFISEAIPNPGDNANQIFLSSLFTEVDVDVPGSPLYLDLYNGNPTTTGTSVLAAITGSATRTDIAPLISQFLWPTLANSENGAWGNPDRISIAAASGATTNINYAALYDSSTGGTLLLSAPLVVLDYGTGIWKGREVTIPAMGLILALGNIPQFMLTEGGVFMNTEGDIVMLTE
jgi:hypothetical protein